MLPFRLIIILDLLNLIDALDRSRIKWQNCEAKCELYNTQVGVLQKDINNLNGRLLKCQAQLNNVSNAKKNVENEYALVIEKLQEIVKVSYIFLNFLMD